MGSSGLPYGLQARCTHGRRAQPRAAAAALPEGSQLTRRCSRPASRLQSMLKDGHKHLSGLEEAVIKNIDACKQLSKITRTSLGPNGALRA